MCAKSIVAAVAILQHEFPMMSVKQPERDLDLEADEALEAARSMPSGPEKSEALRRAGLLRKAADAIGITFAKRGRPPK